ncbi:N-acetylmuramoyl-L-alanine amidase [Streptomyces sp. NPDC007063]|uniref:peptidoglycan recognition protein family protein n=1 Tax=Streptomyces sp. NPDC007063 TaxID=3364772 RepID=UPI0036C7B7B3
MRANRVQTVGVVSAAALLLSLAPLATTATASTAFPASTASTAFPSSFSKAPQSSAASASAGSAIPGRTQSLSFAGSSEGGPGARAAESPDAGVRVPARTVRPYSLLGVVWDGAGTPLRARVQVRTRDADSGHWSAWRHLENHPVDARGGTRGPARGATAPLWVGSSDGVEARVLPERTEHGGSLPDGLRLELVDPGPDPSPAQGKAPGHSAAPGPSEEPADGQRDDTAAGAAAEGAGAGAAKAEPAGADSAEGAGGGVLPALSREATRSQYPQAGSFVGPRPRIVTRAGWGADEKLREAEFRYTDTVKAAFVHHTAMTNDYACDKAPSLIRAMYRYHVKSSHWRDIGYNFLVDKCGTVYEGRAGGVAKPVMGAHTYGFNTDSTGIAVLGSYGKQEPSERAVDALARLTAWKLGLFGADPAGKTWLTSGGGKFKKGRKIHFHTVSGHRDGFVTECPGDRLYAKLGAVRSAAARLQGR